MALKVTTVDKPIAGVGTEDPKMYAEISELMEAEAPAALDNDEKEIQIEADSKTEAEQYAGYARAWGKRQAVKLEIRRISARNGQPANVVRLSVKTFNPDAPALAVRSAPETASELPSLRHT